LTDATDENLSQLHGAPYSRKLANGLTGKGVRQAHIERDGTIVFASGRVDFSPKWSITPESAPNFFPPKAIPARFDRRRRLFAADPLRQWQERGLQYAHDRVRCFRAEAEYDVQGQSKTPARAASSKASRGGRPMRSVFVGNCPVVYRVN
jgi:hypothetical protein